MADNFNLGEAILGTGVDLSGLQKGLDKAENETKQKSSKYGEFFGNVFAFATGGLLASGIQTLTGTISSFFTDAFADARGAQQLMAQSEAVITSTGGAAGKSAKEIADLASSLSDAAGKSLFGGDQIQQAENLFLTFTNIKGAVFDAATAISVDMAQALGGAPKDQAIQLGKALNDPINGITALTRVGVTFTDQQKEQIRAMQEAGDMAGAQGIILAELNKEFGGSAAAAAAATGGWSEFQGRLGEAGETIATAVLPIVGQLGTFLLDTLMPVIESLATNAVPALTAAWQTVQPGFQFVIDNATPISAALAAMGATILVSLIPPFIAWASAAVAAAAATIVALAPVVLPIAAIGVAIGVLTAAWTNDWGGIRTTITDFWDNTGKPIFETLKTWLDTTLTAALTTLAGFWTNTLKPALDAVWNFVNQYLIPIFVVLVGTHVVAIKMGLQGLADVWNNTLKPAWAGLKSFVNDTLGPVLSSLKTTYIDPVAHAFGDISEAISGVIGWIGRMIDKLSTISIPSWLKGSSPPPMADWFSYIADAAADVTDQLPDFGARVALPKLSTAPSLASGGTTYIFNIDARGSQLSEAQFEATIRRVMNESGSSALSRIRTGG